MRRVMDGLAWPSCRETVLETDPPAFTGSGGHPGLEFCVPGR
jgi:hypothetical protein